MAVVLLGAFALMTLSSDLAALQSKSRQFIVTGPEVADLAATASLGVGRAVMTPDVLAVTAEKVKSEYLRALGRRDQWRYNVVLAIDPERQPESPVIALARGYKDGWQYQMAVPQEVEVEKLVRALVTTLIREQVGRRLLNREPDLPLWLTEGMTRHVFNSGAEPLVPRVGQGQFWKEGPQGEPVYALPSVYSDGRKLDTTVLIRAALGERPLMSFDELAFPKAFDPAGPEALRFQLSAHLFVHHLLQLDSSGRKLATMIDGLADVLNWQTAFLSAFNEDFKSLLEVEKWWALVMAQFASTQSILRADELLDVVMKPDATFGQLEVLLRVDSRMWQFDEEEPEVNRLSIQELISGTGFDEHESHLVRTTEQLAALIPRSDPSLTVLVAGYYQTLGRYVEGRRRASTLPSKSNGRWTINPAVVTRRTIGALNDLDELRVRLHADWIRSRAEPLVGSASDGQ